MNQPKPTYPDFEVKYKSLLGDIDFFHDVLKNKDNPDIIKMQGWEFNWLETIYVRQGRYKDVDGKVVYDTEGYGIGSSGLLKMIAFIFPQSQTINFFAKHFDVQYHWSKIKIDIAHPLAGTEFKGINIVVK